MVLVITLMLFPNNINVETVGSKKSLFLEMLPGENNFKKALYSVLGGGATAGLIASDIYIPNEETLILIAFLIMSRLAYVKLSAPISSLFESYVQVKF